jgi:hypothetical protein
VAEFVVAVAVVLAVEVVLEDLIHHLLIPKDLISTVKNTLKSRPQEVMEVVVVH